MTDWIEWARKRHEEATARLRDDTIARLLRQGYTPATADEMADKQPCFALGDVSDFARRSEALERGVVKRVRPVKAARHRGIHAITHETDIPWVEGVWVDFGLSLTIGDREYPVSRETLSGGRHGSKVPSFAGFPYHLDQAAYVKIVGPHVQRLTAQWDGLANGLFEHALKAARAKKDKLDRTAERVENPASKARREREARERAVKSFTSLLFNLRDQVGDLDATEVLRLLELASRKEALLGSLAQWVKTYPLGSKLVGLKDVETALDQARVQEVLKS